MDNVMGRKKKPPLEEKDLQGFKYLRGFFKSLKQFHCVNDHRNREFYYDQYLSLILFYFFNPILTSLRGIQQATTLKKVQKILGVKKIGLSTLSEASYVFDADLILPLLKELARKACPIEKDPKLKDIEQILTAVDGTLLPALPKMLWALWLDDEHRAAKLHLEFDIQGHLPAHAKITDGNGNERDVLREFLSPDKLYTLDAGYAEYKLFNEIKKAESSFVVRLKDNAVWDIIEEKPLTEEDKEAGVTRDIVAWLGSKNRKDDCPFPVRIIEVFHEGKESERRKSRVSSKKTFRTKDTDYTMLLVTDRMDLSAEIIALVYRYRWQIELFFRWFKCILGCTNLLALSQNGLTIQVYCALIASMLITLWTGRKPTKRTFEMLNFYFMGWADDEEITDHIEKLKEINEKNGKV